MQWSFIVAGAFILSLVAFISGVRMGKGLSDFKQTGASSVKAQAKEQKSSPFRVEAKSPEPQLGKESRSPIFPSSTLVPGQRKASGGKGIPSPREGHPSSARSDESSPPAQGSIYLASCGLEQSRGGPGTGKPITV